ncbi:MAG: hypothetical protein DDT18_01437 [Actinobacteria bacterium]|nr:hypothetical protein [Actinomycetota bacterium]
MPLPADKEISFRQFEAIGDLNKGIDSLLSLLLFPEISAKKAVGAVAFAAYPPPQLVKLGQTEALGIFYEHNRSLWHIHSYLYHRGGNKNIHSIAPELFHNLGFLN